MPNKHPFHPEGSSAVSWTTWWEIVPSSASSTRLSGAFRLLTRCQNQFGWKEDLAKRVLLAYKDFIYACSFLPSDNWLLPSPHVHKMWQQHIFDTKQYAQDCQLLLGKFLHYNLYKQTVDEDLVEKYRTTIEFIKDKTSQDELDNLVWKFQDSTAITSSGNHHHLLRTVDTPLKRSLSSTEDDDGDDDKDEDEDTTSDTVLQKRPQKRIRRLERKHPWDKSETDAHATIQIHFQPTSKNCLEQKQEQANDENTGFALMVKDFELAKHVPLNRIFLEFAKGQKVERKCLTFRCHGKVLEGTETPHVLRKNSIVEEKQNGDNVISIECESVLLEC
jgi:hypothetical protein